MLDAKRFPGLKINYKWEVSESGSRPSPVSLVFIAPFPIARACTARSSVACGVTHGAPTYTKEPYKRTII